QAGLPVYGVFIYAGSFGDGINRSVSAPGLGVLACSSEVPGAVADPKDACGFAARRARILAAEAEAGRLREILGEQEAQELLRAARHRWGHHFYGGGEVSPLRGALVVWGLGFDDLAVISKHDTSTQANDL